MRISWVSADKLLDSAQRRLAPVDVLLDIGCGIRPQSLVAPLVHICCEPFPEYAERLQETVQATPGRPFVVLRLSWAAAMEVLPDRSVDSVFLLDVIEHIEKEEALRLLRATERVARRQIAVFTPLGFMPQPRTGGPDAWGLGGDVVQEHRSGWLPEDFDDSWEIVASKDFHTTGHDGKPLSEPFGAFFAIKNLGGAEADAREQRNGLLRSILTDGSSIEEPEVLARAAELMHEAARVFRPQMLVPPRTVLRAELRLRDSWIVRLGHGWWTRLVNGRGGGRG
jgi:hypothetical protein